MAEYRKAINRNKPKNKAAKRTANAVLAKETGGRKLTMGPKDADLRKKWMDAYIAAGGEYKVVKTKGKKPKDTGQPCLKKKVVTARILSVEFLNDHRDTSNKKLLKKPNTVRVRSCWRDHNTGTVHCFDVDSKMGDSFTEFVKPEWDLARGGSADSHPVSYTKNRNTKVKVKVEFTVKPDGESASFDKLIGMCAKDYLSFEAAVGKTLKTQTLDIEVMSKGKLPNHVDLLEHDIDWKGVVDGDSKPLGQSGKHKIYVTFDTPHGKLAWDAVNTEFMESGSDQIITESRLEYAVKAAKGMGVSDEKECVDAIFVELLKRGVGYFLGHRWSAGASNVTGITPKPPLHYYMWLCNEHNAFTECHNIAAAFLLACRIIGVKKSFKVGYMYPWPSREEVHPTYPKTTTKSSSSRNILGKLASPPLGLTHRDHRCRRNHTGAGHGREYLVFVDGSDRGNNFEGVTVYDRRGLYAIGDDVFDHYSDMHDNASCYYGDRTVRTGSNRNLRLTPAGHFDKGLFDLRFSGCSKPYPWSTTSIFRWED